MERLFAFARVLHMTPRDVDQLTVTEYDYLAANLDAYLREMDRATRAAKNAAEGVNR